MARIGYARVSTTDQDLSLQLATLKAAGCDPIRAEKVSGASTTGRTELAIVLDFIGAGDTLVVTRIDRLARSIGDLQDIVRSLKAKAKGVYKGRPPSIEADKVRALKDEGIGPAEIARRLGIGRASVYRVLRGASADPVRMP